MIGLKHYLDDSGTDGLSPIVVIGGPVMQRLHFKEFAKRWRRLLDSYKIFGSLHMQDFVRPYGRHIGINPEMKLGLFRSVVRLINEHKLYSLSVDIPQAEFKSQLSEEVQKNLMGPYALAFFSVILANQHLASTRHHEGKTAYLVDTGSSHQDQLVFAHHAILELEKGRPEKRFTGVLGFDSDENVAALQAADVIAWAARRRELGKLCDEFAPLRGVLSKNKPSHAHISIPADGIRMWSDPINNWIMRKGTIPSFGDFLVWEQGLGRVKA